MNTQQRIDEQRSALRARFGLNPRHCTRCKQLRPREGGREVAFNGGRNQRWECARCGGAS